MQLPRQKREISWCEPRDVIAAASGLTMPLYLEAVIEGRLPNSPAIELLALILTDAHEGSARATFKPDAIHLNAAGAVHGGIISAALDSCIGYAVQSTLVPGETFVTAQLNTQFIRGIGASGETLAVSARLSHRGRRTAVAESSLTDPRGRLIATASATCMILGGGPG